MSTDTPPCTRFHAHASMHMPPCACLERSCCACPAWGRSLRGLALVPWPTRVLSPGLCSRFPWEAGRGASRPSPGGSDGHESRRQLSPCSRARCPAVKCLHDQAVVQVASWEQGRPWAVTSRWGRWQPLPVGEAALGPCSLEEAEVQGPQGMASIPPEPPASHPTVSTHPEQPHTPPLEAVPGLQCQGQVHFLQEAFPDSPKPTFTHAQTHSPPLCPREPPRVLPTPVPPRCQGPTPWGSAHWGAGTLRQKEAPVTVEGNLGLHGVPANPGDLSAGGFGERWGSYCDGSPGLSKLLLLLNRALLVP